MVEQPGPDNILLIEGHITDADAEFIHEWVGRRTELDIVSPSLICLKNVRGGKITIGTLEMMMDPVSMIDTWGVGYLHSAGATLLSMGRNRMLHPDSELMFHMAKGDPQNVAKFMNAQITITAGMTGMDEEEVVDHVFCNFKMDNYMSPEKALNLRLIDEITNRLPNTEEYKNVTLR